MKKLSKFVTFVIALPLILTACSFSDNLSQEEKNKIIEEANKITKETENLERKNAEKNEESSTKNNIPLDKTLKSISIDASISEIKIFKSNSNTNSLEINKNDYNFEEGQNVSIKQKNPANILTENKITIYLATDLEKLDIKTKDADIKIFDVNLGTVNIENTLGETKLFNSPAKNITLQGETKEIVIDTQTNLESLNIHSNISDIKLFSVNSKFVNISGKEHRILFTNTYSPKIILDTLNSRIQGSLSTNGNKLNFVDSKESVKTTDHSIYVDKSKNEFSVELK